MTDTILDIQNVKQMNGVDDVDIKKTVAAKLKDMIVEQKQEKMDNGNIKITLILDPKIQGVKK